MGPTLCVAVCTHNRLEQLLRLALPSLLQQAAPAHDFEILVVDNASTDATSARIRAMLPESGNLRLVDEPVLGLSSARNRALRETDARYVAFIDDDEIAAPDWVDSLLRAIREIGPDAACLGGPIRPRWKTGRPSWLPDQLLGALSVVDQGSVRRAVNPWELPLVGGNICFERHRLVAVGGFDLTLGRVGAQLLCNEETLAQQRVAADGGGIWYLPDACVHHEIPAARLSRSWFAQRFWGQGVSDARMARISGGSLPRLAARNLRELARAEWHFVAGEHRGLTLSQRATMRLCALCRLAGVTQAWLSERSAAGVAESLHGSR